MGRAGVSSSKNGGALRCACGMMKILLQSSSHCEAGTGGGHRQWYPDAIMNDLDPTKHHSIEVLGQCLGLNRDAEKQCFTNLKTCRS